MTTAPPYRDPFDDLENRRVAEWKRVLASDPALLQSAPPGAILTWDEIPDVLALAAPKADWLVEGLLPAASVTLLAGEPGSYKTWLALALLRGVDGGGTFLGRRCAESAVLYLDRENPLRVVQERLAVLGISAPQRSRIWGGWLADAPPAIGDARLLEIARQRRPLMVFDSLIRFHDADENSATEMALVMGGLRALAHAGATVVALHHKPKSEGSLYRGSSDIAGGVDTAIAVSRDRGPNGAPGSSALSLGGRARGADLLRVECFKSRFAEEFTLTLRPDLSASGDFAVTSSPQADAEQADIDRLAEVISQNPGQPRDKIIRDSGVPQHRARTIIERFTGKLWFWQQGAHNAKLFFPADYPRSGLPLNPEDENGT
jgi:AAA domain